MTPQEDNSKKENTETPEFELEWLDDFDAEEEASVEAEETAEAEAVEEVPSTSSGTVEDVKSEEPEKKEEPPKEEEPATAEPVEAAEAEEKSPKAEETAKEEEPAAEVDSTSSGTEEAADEDAEEAARRRREKRKAAARRRRLEEERRKKRRVSTILMVICVIVAIGSAALVIRAVYYYQNARSTYTDARDNNVASVQQTTTTPAPIEADPVVEPPAEEEPEEDVRPEGAVLDIDFASLKEINPEIVGWLHVPALDLSYPIMQAADNEYYLTHTLENEYNPLGSIFMECTNLPDFSHGNTLIYGHNTVDGTMFGRLREFGDNPGLRASEPYFYVYQADGKIGKYKIYSYYSVYKESDSFSWFTDDESYDYYVNMTKNLSIENIEADFSKRNNLVTLSTCFGASGTPYRFLVHGVRE